MKKPKDLAFKARLEGVEPIVLAGLLLDFRDMARPELDCYKQDGWTAGCFESTVQFCRLCVSLLKEKSFHVGEVTECIASLIEVCNDTRLQIEDRLFAKKCLEAILLSLVPNIEMKPYSKLDASDSPDAVIARQDLLATYNLLRSEINVINRSSGRERAKRIADFKKRFEVRITKPNFKRQPALLARRVLSDWCPIHPGVEQLKRILARARKERKFLFEKGE